MSADNVFNAAVAIAREVVDERPIGAMLNKALERSQFLLTPWRQRNPVEWSQLNQAASEFVAPYLQRIAELQDVCEKHERTRTIESDLTRKALALNARIAELESKLLHVHEQTASLPAQIESLRAIRTTLECEVVELHDTIAKLESDLDACSRRECALHVMLSNYALPTEPKAFAAQYERERNAHVDRIAKLEAENRTIRDAGKMVADRYSLLVSVELEPHDIQGALDVLRGAS